MPLPAVKELIVEDHAVHDQNYEARYCQCQSHRITSERRDERPVRPAEEGADDDEDHVEHHQGEEERVGQQALAANQLPDALGAAVEVRHQQQQRHHRCPGMPMPPQKAE